MHQFTPYSVYIAMAILAIWTIAWKICALWTAVKNGQKRWFLVLVILNTAGILEIIYIFKIAKKSWSDVKQFFTEKI